MNRPIRTILAVVAAGVMTLSCGTDEKLDTISQQLEELRKAQEEMQKKQDDLQKQQDDMQKQQDNMQKDMDRMNDDLDKIGNQSGSDPEIIGKIYDNALVDEPAAYKGGQAAMLKFITDNLRYPEEAKKIELQGRVIVKILIDKTGTVKECNIMKSLSRECDAEAQRVCMSLKAFNPAKHEGKTVSVWMTIPIAFRL